MTRAMNLAISASTSAVILFLVFTAPSAAAAGKDPRPVDPAAAGNEAVAGVVLDAGGKPVVGASVFVCDAQTGVPVSTVTLRPFSEPGYNNLPARLAHGRTDERGSFRVERLKPGTYRLVAQSWGSGAGFEKVMGDDSRSITFHGAAEGVKVPSEGALACSIRSAARTGSLRVKVDADDTFVLLSTRPTPADPVLLFFNWKGEFLKHLIGAQYLKHEETTVHGVPEGKVYVSVMRNDRRPSGGEAVAEVRAGRTVEVHAPFVAGRGAKPPPRLAPLYEQMKRQGERAFGDALARALGVEQGRKMDSQEQLKHLFSIPFDKKVALPGGGEATVGDILSASAYLQLEEEKARRRPRGPQPPTQPAK